MYMNFGHFCTLLEMQAKGVEQTFPVKLTWKLWNWADKSLLPDLTCGSDTSTNFLNLTYKCPYLPVCHISVLGHCTNQEEAACISVSFPSEKAWGLWKLWTCMTQMKAKMRCAIAEWLVRDGCDNIYWSTHEIPLFLKFKSNFFLRKS